MRKLAVLGPKDTYCDKAARSLAVAYQIQYSPNILEVVHQISETTDAVVPFENTLDGFVMESLDGIIKTNAYIHSQIKLEVNFSFVSFECSLEKVKEVYVQFKAYGQCQDFILKHGLTPIITQSNIESLELIQKREKKHVGAIIPNHCNTKVFPLVFTQILRNVKDETRFVLLSQKEPQVPQEKEFCCSVAITPKVDRPGVLYSILKSFNDKGINLRAILSRPRKDIMGKYIFYMEFVLKQDDLASLKELQDQIVEKKSCSLQILGFYNLL